MVYLASAAGVNGQVFPKTLGANLKPPPGTAFGTRLDERPAGGWNDLGPGQRFWQRPWEER